MFQKKQKLFTSENYMIVKRHTYFNLPPPKKKQPENTHTNFKNQGKTPFQAEEQL